MKQLIFFISCLVLFSCSEPEKTTDDETTALIEQVEQNEPKAYDLDEKIEDFRSDLRVGKTDWDEEETYTDTMEFVEYNDEYDYAYAIFKTTNGEEIQLYSEIDINNYYRNRNYVVKWKVGKFYEAGEGDAVYYQEKVVAADQLKSSFSFEEFLGEFSETYKANDQAVIKKHIHPFEDLVTTYKNGLYCVEGKPEFLSETSYLKDNYIISPEKPEGDFCAGYEGVSDGLYYEFFDEAHDLFPRVNDMDAEGAEGMLYVTEDIIYQYFAKVLVITNEEFNRALYFFMENDNWYFWVEDFCDCSA